MINFGPVPIGAVLPIFFDTFAGATGASITMTGLAVTDIEVYKGTSMTQRASDAGYTLLDTDGIDVDTITGIHGFSIDTGDNTDAGFYASGSFYTVVVSAVTVDSQTVNFIAATFRCVTAEGVAGQPKVDVAAAAGTAWGSGAITAASIASDAITDAKVASDVTIASVTGAVGSVTGAVGSVTGSVGSVASGGITAASIADGAIDLATFAADAKALMGVIAFGTAQAVTGTTIRLASAETFADSEIIGATVLIRSASTGAGQARVITAYSSATDECTVDTWTTTPTGTITYVVFASPPASTSVPASVNVTQWAGAAVATPSVAGVPEVDLTHVAGATTNVSALATNVDAILTDTGTTLDTAVSAIKTKTDFLPSATAGSAGGVFIAGSNAATSITTALTANITGNLSGSVGSVTATVNADVKKVNAVTVNGDGGATPWGP